MWELRWVLLVLGAGLIAFVYLLGRGVLRWRRAPKLAAPAERVEPGTNGLDSPRAFPDTDVTEPKSEPASAPAPTPAPTPAPAAAPSPERTPPEPADPGRTDRIVTIRFVPKSGELAAEDTIVALRKAGLTHGRYGIFHRHENGRIESAFSVANLTEPGSFELSNLAERTIPGMSFFMVLPGAGDPVERFDRMVETARSLAHDLDAELHDEKGSSWSIQRERYVREEIIRYRHQLELS